VVLNRRDRDTGYGYRVFELLFGAPEMVAPIADFPRFMNIDPARGAGRSRLYSFNDLVALRVARELREKGISIQSLKKVVKKLRTISLENPLAGPHLLVIGKDVAIVKSPSEIESILLKPGQLYLTSGLIFDLRKPMAEVRLNIVNLRVA
jgi:DNA-binding transcriptional MerR regulator